MLSGSLGRNHIICKTMKTKSYRPDARQSALIWECGADPNRYKVIGEDHGWLYCIDRDGRQVHFDLVRKMPCYTREI